MTKEKVENIIVISFIGLIVTLLVGLGGNLVLKAELPATVSKNEVNFEKRVQALEQELVAGDITRQEYDSLSDLLRIQIMRKAALQEEIHNPDRIPDWVGNLGITEPDGMKFEHFFSNFTSVNDPSEGFNSVSLVYTGDYDKAIEEAGKIAEKANLSVGGVFKAKGSPYKSSEIKRYSSGISYMNYSLGNADKDFLISLQVEPSGRLTIMVTDNKQLKDRLLVYEPLNNRQNSTAKKKKQ